jgi:hypothetical protein
MTQNLEAAALLVTQPLQQPAGARVGNSGISLVADTLFVFAPKSQYKTGKRLPPRHADASTACSNNSGFRSIGFT